MLFNPCYMSIACTNITKLKHKLKAKASKKAILMRILPFLYCFLTICIFNLFLWLQLSLLYSHYLLKPSPRINIIISAILLFFFFGYTFANFILAMYPILVLESEYCTLRLVLALQSLFFFYFSNEVEYRFKIAYITYHSIHITLYYSYTK